MIENLKSTLKLLTEELSKNKLNESIIIINNNFELEIENENSVSAFISFKEEEAPINYEDKLLEKIADYNPLILTAYHLLSSLNKSSFINLLQTFNIRKNVNVIRMMSDNDVNKFTNGANKLIVTASKGNLCIKQGDWNQTTASKTNTVASDKKIYKDVNAEKSIRLLFDIEVPESILYQLNLNSKKQAPMIATLTGFEPYNLMDLSNDEYIKQKTEADAKAIIYAERYAEHIKLLSNKSPYQAANSFLLLQSELNLSIQKCIRNILLQGNILSVDNLIHYSFENLAEAARELFTKYHAYDTTEEEKIKITRYIALYFAVVEEAQNNVENYIESLNKKFGVKTEETLVNV